MKGKTSAPIRLREARFALVVNAFADDRQVAPPGAGKGFGSGALKVNGKIFAMISSKGEFVVKVSEERVNELVAAGKGSRFDPGRGRAMKEWLVVTADHALWIPLAKEARKLLGKVVSSVAIQNRAPRARGARKSLR
jgi:predicted DNA-binding protein (MmcQ/YjbR family)